MTSMGSGGVIMTLLVLFYSRPLTTLVGTDIAHAVILATVASMGHLALGTIDFRLLVALLLGFDSWSVVCRSHRHFYPHGLVTYGIVFPNCCSWHFYALVAARIAEIEAE